MMLIRRCALPSGVRVATSPRPDSQTSVPSGRTIRYSAGNESTSSANAWKRRARWRSSGCIAASYSSVSPPTVPRPAGQIDSEQRHALGRPAARAGAQVGFPRAHAAGLQRQR
jgi:hypothetical protein